MVSHDLRNPLQVVVGRVALLREAGVEPESVADIERAADRMAQLIDDPLTLARDGSDADVADAVSLELVASQAWGRSPAPTRRSPSSTAPSSRPTRAASASSFENLAFARSNTPARPSRSRSASSAKTASQPASTSRTTARGSSRQPRLGVRTRLLDRDGRYRVGADIVAVVAEAHGWSVAITESQPAALASSSPTSTSRERLGHRTKGVSPTLYARPAVISPTSASR